VRTVRYTTIVQVHGCASRDLRATQLDGILDCLELWKIACLDARRGFAQSLLPSSIPVLLSGRCKISLKSTSRHLATLAVGQLRLAMQSQVRIVLDSYV